MKTVNYINLTNGIEDLEESNVQDARFIRIQSTWCEQKLWDDVIRELDYDFLMNLALGNECVVHDRSARKEVPRALYQGLEFVRFALHACWFGTEITSRVRGNDCTEYFSKCYRKLSCRSVNRLKYFRKFINTTSINLVFKSGSTSIDGKYSVYSNILCRWNESN